jgi:hypothetical protein
MPEKGETKCEDEEKKEGGGCDVDELERWRALDPLTDQTANAWSIQSLSANISGEVDGCDVSCVGDAGHCCDEKKQVDSDTDCFPEAARAIGERGVIPPSLEVVFKASEK